MFGIVFNVATAYGAKPYRYPLLLVSLILFPASADPCYEDFVEQLRIEKCTIHLTGSDQGVEHVHNMTKPAGEQYKQTCRLKTWICGTQ